eukprot:TRINITY_DN12474_c0_g1_i1.p1 TRINITY_DN12474_c0_g1~~TRINITY_DN12474_c0_g1_i1.p1  ORF type:complete len:158 (-),score=45.85 TRINITY_DN12474_c0_g1_i1:23-496(-)
MREEKRKARFKRLRDVHLSTNNVLPLLELIQKGTEEKPDVIGDESDEEYHYYFCAEDQELTEDELYGVIRVSSLDPLFENASIYDDGEYSDEEDMFHENSEPWDSEEIEYPEVSRSLSSDHEYSGDYSLSEDNTYRYEECEIFNNPDNLVYEMDMDE